jgi:hypothetical protein
MATSIAQGPSPDEPIPPTPAQREIRSDRGRSGLPPASATTTRALAPARRLRLGCCRFRQPRDTQFLSQRGQGRLVPAMSLARRDRRKLSDLFKRQTTPNSRDDHFAFFVRQRLERPSGQFGVEWTFTVCFQPQPSLPDCGLFVAAATCIASSRADRTISHDAVQPRCRSVWHAPLSHQLQERLLDNVRRSGNPLRSKQFKSNRMTVKQSGDKFRRYPTHPGKRFERVID